MNAEERWDVVVLGAGMAGLTAARALAERRLRVCVVEARERVGGRLLSVKAEGGGAVELGAEFVHGRAPELWALIDEAGARTVERQGALLREARNGGIAEEDAEDDTVSAPLEEMGRMGGADRTFAKWLVESGLDEDRQAKLTGYVEGFNAADAQRIGVRSLGMQQRAEDAIEGDRSWHVVGGYARLAEHLERRVRESGGEMRLGCEALGLRWRAGEVRVATTMGEMYAARCVVTLPLGVVQRVNCARGVRMEPEPKAVAQARRLEMGHATRFTMVFRERWWERSEVMNAKKLSGMSFLFTEGRVPPVWWTAHPEVEKLPTLTGWVGGPRAAALEGKSAEELGRAACALLAEVFGMHLEQVREALVATYAHDWAEDRFALGAYSYVPVGAIDAPGKMCEAEAEAMYFAGEHTDVTGHWGTVHAAIRSGLRVAGQVLEERR